RRRGRHPERPSGVRSAPAPDPATHPRPGRPGRRGAEPRHAGVGAGLGHRGPRPGAGHVGQSGLRRPVVHRRLAAQDRGRARPAGPGRLVGPPAGRRRGDGGQRRRLRRRRRHGPGRRHGGVSRGTHGLCGQHPGVEGGVNFRGESAFRPVRPGSEPGPRPGLWPTIAGRWLSRQFWIELYGLPGYGATLARPRAETFAAAPRDFRPHDPAVGRAILTGRFLLAGSVMDVEPGGHPWDRACPTRRFAMDLHSFAWLPSLMLSGEKGAREGLRLTLAWQTEFARWSPFAWGPSL